ncbi:class I SAM-dependent methyltransferase [Candidatus Woesearchaeota archaeon]|nr:class I SAM-dependent methyltransferase [Candidatus Woesearchaeota archaeon]
MKKRVESVENRWDILYRDYPEVYDEFASVKKYPKWIHILPKMFDFKGKVIADIGSGSGLSAFDLAKYAKKVIGIEPEDAMRNLAIKNVKKKKIKSVEFKKGTATKIPLEKDSVDFVVGATLVGIHTPARIKRFVKEATRIVKKGGHIITINIAPEWYGGELAPIILGKSRKTKVDAEGVVDRTLRKLGFKYKDYYQIQNYGSVAKAVRTYGFIFGRKTIDFIRKHKRTKIKWKLRIHYKKIT